MCNSCLELVVLDKNSGDLVLCQKRKHLIDKVKHDIKYGETKRWQIRLPDPNPTGNKPEDK